jgi:SAM-dependent methyltransferase
MAKLQSEADAPRYIVDSIIDDVTERLGFLRFQFQKALVIGDWGYGIGDSLERTGVPSCTCTIASFDFDAEQPFAKAEYDLILSFCELGTINDLPGALIHMRNALTPGGLMIASFPGAGSLPALRQAMLAADGEKPAARIHPQIDVRVGAQLLQRAGYADPVADSHPLEVRFGSLHRLVADLRAQGLANVLTDPAPSLSKSILDQARAAFAASGDGGKTTECFEIVTLTGWRR